MIQWTACIFNNRQHIGTYLMRQLEEIYCKWLLKYNLSRTKPLAGLDIYFCERIQQKIIQLYPAIVKWKVKLIYDDQMQLNSASQGIFLCQEF